MTSMSGEDAEHAVVETAHRRTLVHLVNSAAVTTTQAGSSTSLSPPAAFARSSSSGSAPLEQHGPGGAQQQRRRRHVDTDSIASQWVVIDRKTPAPSAGMLRSSSSPAVVESPASTSTSHTVRSPTKDSSRHKASKSLGRRIGQLFQPSLSSQAGTAMNGLAHRTQHLAHSPSPSRRGTASTVPVFASTSQSVESGVFSRRSSANDAASPPRTRKTSAVHRSQQSIARLISKRSDSNPGVESPSIAPRPSAQQHVSNDDRARLDSFRFGATSSNDTQHFYPSRAPLEAPQIGLLEMDRHCDSPLLTGSSLANVGSSSSSSTLSKSRRSSEDTRRARRTTSAAVPLATTALARRTALHATPTSPPPTRESHRSPPASSHTKRTHSSSSSLSKSHAHKGSWIAALASANDGMGNSDAAGVRRAFTPPPPLPASACESIAMHERSLSNTTQGSNAAQSTRSDSTTLTTPDGSPSHRASSSLFGLSRASAASSSMLDLRLRAASPASASSSSLVRGDERAARSCDDLTSVLWGSDNFGLLDGTDEPEEEEVINFEQQHHAAGGDEIPPRPSSSLSMRGRASFGQLFNKLSRKASQSHKDTGRVSQEEYVEPVSDAELARWRAAGHRRRRARHDAKGPVDDEDDDDGEVLEVVSSPSTTSLIPSGSHTPTSPVFAPSPPAGDYAPFSSPGVLSAPPRSRSGHGGRLLSDSDDSDAGDDTIRAESRPRRLVTDPSAWQTPQTTGTLSHSSR